MEATTITYEGEITLKAFGANVTAMLTLIASIRHPEILYQSIGSFSLHTHSNEPESNWLTGTN
jgi:hypothetical protein